MPQEINESPATNCKTIDSLDFIDLLKAASDNTRDASGNPSHLLGGDSDTLEMTNIFQPSNDGQSPSDVQQAMKVKEAAEAEAASAKESMEWLNKDENFKKVDRDGDGFISKDELMEACLNAEKGSAEAKALGFLSRNFNDLQNASNDEWGVENDGITRNDMKEYPNWIVDKRLSDWATKQHLINKQYRDPDDN